MFGTNKKTISDEKLKKVAEELLSKLDGITKEDVKEERLFSETSDWLRQTLLKQVDFYHEINQKAKLPSHELVSDKISKTSQISKKYRSKIEGTWDAIRALIILVSNEFEKQTVRPKKYRNEAIDSDMSLRIKRFQAGQFELNASARSLANAIKIFNIAPAIQTSET